MTMRVALTLPLLGLLCIGGLLAASGCASTVANRSAVGERFPSVSGQSLDGTSHRLPEDLRGKRAVLLIGYVQNAQFDLDRWILGLVQAGVDLPIYEVPTIPGLIPGMFSGTIDNGMRSGIPSEDWGSVITVYDDGDRIVELTGNETPRNGRVLLLDGEGKIRWQHDRGYSAAKLMELVASARSLRESPAPAQPQ